MFNFERQFSIRESETVSVTETVGQSVQQSLEQRQRSVFESHRHRIFSLAFYMTGSEIEAEEILAQTFVRAFRKDLEPNGFAADSALLSELAERFPLGQEQPAAVISQAGDLCGINVHRNDLEAAIRMLPAAERLIFLLRDVEGYSADAAAKLLELPLPQVERTAFSARLRLRQILADVAHSKPEAA